MPITSPESTTIRLPRAIRERSERVRALIEQEKQRRNPQPPTAQADPPQNPADASPAPPIAAPAPMTPEPEASTASGLQPGDPRENDVGYWRQRAKAVFGMFERSRADLAELKAINRELRDQLATKEATAPAAPVAIDLESLFTPEEREQYGDKQLELLARTATRLSAQQAQDLVTKATKPLQDRIEEGRKTEAEHKWDQFSHRVVVLCPDVFEINETAEFKAWLDEVDPASGVSWNTQLQAHQGRYDAAAVAGLFNRYKAARLGTATPAAPAAPKPPVVPPRSGGGSGSGDAPAQGEVLTYPTQKEIRDFYKRCSINGGRGVSKEERAKFEARMRQAEPA